MIREVWLWCIISCIHAFWAGTVVYCLLDIKKDLNMYSQQCTQLFNKCDAKVTNSEAVILSKMDKITMSVSANKLFVNKDGNVQTRCLSKLLLSIIDFKESFFNDALTKDKIYKIKQIFHVINDNSIENALDKIEKLNDKEINTFKKLKEFLKIIISRFHYRNANLFEKFLSKWVFIKNNNSKLWKNLKELEFYVDNNHWNNALNFAKKELNSFDDLQSWIINLEDLVTIEKNISLIYNQLSKHIIASSGNE